MKVSSFCFVPVFLLVAFISVDIYAQNPYLPMWEYIPDGEPYVFEDPDTPGKFRVYIYGSHDSFVTSYCGSEQVVWSAPVEDLSSWRYDGIIFRSLTDRDGHLLNRDGKGDVLFAPDVALKVNSDGKKEYYLYPNDQNGGRNSLVAKSSRPDGPFVVCNWSNNRPDCTEGVLGFDPAVFVDDDGRVYGYWGFGESYGAELDPVTMSTVKEGCSVVENMVSGYQQEGEFRFYEASSMRKIKDKYVLIYSRTTAEGEFGLPSSNYTLAYAYSDNPLGPFVYGGTLIDGRARGTDVHGNIIPTAYPYGNTHGSLCNIMGHWWLFYHRQTGTDEYSRQAMVTPVKVKVHKGEGGKVLITEGEYNSMGFLTDGLDPLSRSSAGWACYLTSPDGVTQEYPDMFFTGSYIEPNRFDPESYQGPFNQKQPFCPIVNNTSGSVVGYKYFNFNKTVRSKGLDLVAHLVPEGIDGVITVMVGAPTEQQGGFKIGEMTISAGLPQQMTEIRVPVDPLTKIKGRKALFFIFHSETEATSICSFYDFMFVKR